MDKQYKCRSCKDKGFIDTGNNDLPCSCRLGKKTLFNVCGEDYPVTGDYLIKKDKKQRNTNQGYLD